MITGTELCILWFGVVLGMLISELLHLVHEAWRARPRKD